MGNLKPTFEPILWLVKPYKLGGTIADNILQHGVGAYNQTAFLNYTDTPENILSCGFEPQEAGYHPMQKPILLMQALIELTTTEEHLVLDPFCGSGSTLVAARNLNRDFLGFEISPDYVRTAKERLAMPVQTHLTISVR